MTAAPFSALTPEEQAAAVRRLWEDLRDLINGMWEAIKPVWDALRPLLAVHRAEVRRVHTAYRQRRRRRW